MYDAAQPLRSELTSALETLPAVKYNGYSVLPGGSSTKGCFPAGQRPALSPILSEESQAVPPS